MICFFYFDIYQQFLVGVLSMEEIGVPLSHPLTCGFIPKNQLVWNSWNVGLPSMHGFPILRLWALMIVPFRCERLLSGIDSVKHLL